MDPKSNIFIPREPAQNERPKTSAIKTFIHRRGHSNGATLPSMAWNAFAAMSDVTANGTFAKNNPGALGELQHNQQESGSRSPRKSRDDSREDSRGRSGSPTKNSIGNFSFRTSPTKVSDKDPRAPDSTPAKPKKVRSAASLGGILSKPKSLKNLQRLITDDEVRLSKDKENRTPDGSYSTTEPPTPIFTQFTNPAPFRRSEARASMDVSRNELSPDLCPGGRAGGRKERPKSFQVPLHAKMEGRYEVRPSPTRSGFSEDSSRKSSKGSGTDRSTKSSRSRVFGAFTLSSSRVKSAKASPAPDTTDGAELVLDPKDIDKHLEAMLDRRNIPENQRYKMRNLADTIKMEFIRQDWAEMQASKSEQPGSPSNNASACTATASSDHEEKPKRGRGKSFTLSRAKKEASSTTKKSKPEGTIGRHFRSKSTDSVSADRPSSSQSLSNSGLLSKMKMQQGPADYVAYLRKVQKPQLVEVGKVHKLRLLLRNETVTWIEEFIKQGGMMEIVGLLNRTMDVEWREEHEDALLHENLLCLKALSTTARAMQYLHTIQSDLFPKLVGMLFDPEKKGPSEFTTRNIITSVLFTYIESAGPAERVIRAKSVLKYLRDPEPSEEKRPPAFVMEMRQERPYRVWCKEVVSVTKEVFWIFLHNLNVVALPPNLAMSEDNPSRDEPYAYMIRNFPQERPPVPAAPYVGGVEWDATNYLASHLDLMNAILACTSTVEERNRLREGFQISGWERCLGGSMRLCKEKFYGSVHDGLRRWVAAAAEDGWNVKDVRYGPPPESRGSPKKIGGDQKKKQPEEAPKIEMPKLDFKLDKAPAANDAWL